MDGEVCGDLGALCHDRKGAFGRSYPIDDRVFRENERLGGGVVRAGENGKCRRVVYPSLGGFLDLRSIALITTRVTATHKLIIEKYLERM